VFIDINAVTTPRVEEVLGCGDDGAGSCYVAISVVDTNKLDIGMCSEWSGMD
jgi:hypothetical protein